MWMRLRWFLLLAATPLLLGGCVGSMLSKNLGPNVNEQLYIDARLNFAIKHPLDWQRQEIPVSSPAYRADTVRWTIKSSTDRGTGAMLIRHIPVPGNSLEDLLSSYLHDLPELRSSLVERFNHPAGPALQLLGHDSRHGRLTIALNGQQQDFIIAFDFPSDRFEELLPTFQEIVGSFIEVTGVEPTDN